MAARRQPFGTGSLQRIPGIRRSVLATVFACLVEAGFSDAAEIRDAEETAAVPVTLVNAFPEFRFQNPIRLRHSGDGTNRLFIGSQMGSIHSILGNRETPGKNLILQLEKGDQLMDFVFHPAFSSNGYLYAYYREGGERATRSVLSRFQVGADRDSHVDPETEMVILEIERSFHPGSLQFGPDGLLYFVLGYEFYYPDMNPGQTTDPADNYNHLLGTMIRIDVDHPDDGRAYRIPPDNPFVDDDSIPDEVWAYGFREPWRFCFHPKTGACWLGDNGQWAYEEVNLVVPGAHYGWPFHEGFLPFDERHSRRSRGGMEKGATFRFGGPPAPSGNFIPPVIEYPHRVGVCVVGGEFYFGTRVPELQGTYVYGDFQYGKIWSMRWNGEKVEDHAEIGRIPANLTSFGTDEAGEIYITAFDGSIYRLERETEPEQSTPE